jgi:hypothetical protein
MSSLAPERASRLVQTVLNGRTADRPLALFDLIVALAEREDQVEPYDDAALAALREVYPDTPQYEVGFQECLRSRRAA